MRVTGTFEIEDIAEPDTHSGLHGQNSSILFNSWKRIFNPSQWSLGTRGGGNDKLNHNNSSFSPLPIDESSSYDDDNDASTPRGRWCPEENANLVSHLLFSWVNGLLLLGKEKMLQQDDLWDLAAQDAAIPVSTEFEYQLAKTIRDDDISLPQGSVWRALCNVHSRRFIFAGIIKLVHDIVMLASPFILEMLLKQVQKRGNPWVGFGLACALAMAAILETLTVNIYFHILFRVCLHMKTELVDTMYKKSLKISESAKSSAGIGALVNIMSNDCAKLWSLPTYLHMIWSGPFQIFAVMGLLVRIIHLIPALVGLAVTIALIPLSALVARSLTRIRKQTIALTDSRVKLCSEVITGIKAIKLYAWEKPYEEKIMKLRRDELAQIKKASLIETWNTVLWIGGPILISMAGFLAYSLMGYPLTASVAFPALSLFNLLRFPVMMLPRQIMNLVNAHVALGRIQKFIETDEIKQAPYQPPGPSPAISINQGTFSWGSTGSPAILSDINLSLARGQLGIVIGDVGSGKSSLLCALLGEMSTKKGSVVVRGSIAYTQQDPWISNATLRDNILLGAPFNIDRYNQVLDACALRPDLEILPAGDETEIGEKGVNLSGGQRHRVALARACYANADVYLMDDPLSAVDAHVGKHLFNECMLRMLGSTSRILVTHQLQYLHAADVIFIMKNGRVVDHGTFESLSSRGVDFHQFELTSNQDASLSSPSPPSPPCSDAAPDIDSAVDSALDPLHKDVDEEKKEKESDSDLADDVDDLEDIPLLVESQDTNSATSTASYNNNYNTTSDNFISPDNKKPVGVSSINKQHQTLAPHQITKAEERAEGQVSRHIYSRYFSNYATTRVRAFIVVGCILFFAFAERALQGVQNWWLSVWSEATATHSLPTTTNATTPINTNDNNTPGEIDTAYYMRVYFILGFVSLFIQIVKAILLVLGSLVAASNLQKSLLHTVLRLPMSFFDSQPTGRLLNRFTKDVEAVDTSLQSSVSSFLNCFVSVFVSLIVVVLVSPGVMLAFIPLIFAYISIQQKYVATSREIKRLDSLAVSPLFSHFSETLHGLAVLRAFRVQNRLENVNSKLLDLSNRCYWPAQCVNRWLSVRLELLGISIVFATAAFVSLAPSITAGLAGLALTSALNLTGLMNWMVRQTTELEVNMNSVERMVEYDTQPQEAPDIMPSRRPLPGWPTRGQICVERLVVRYRPELDPVLHDITFSIDPGEKIGLVGRTGGGKSTLMLALYRIVEASSGRIVIDGIDIASIGLYDLRSRLALVPQDPVLFSGSIRTNLDPFFEAKTGSGSEDADAALWSALDKAGLGSMVRSMDGGLDGHVRESGGNLSAGQRQLLCMARALLRSARILLLDEATSSIDTGTDAAIQSMVTESFAHCTTLTIAHRLHTIIGSDRVMVLDGGRVKEFDAPQELLKKSGGAFRGLVEETQSTKGRTSTAGNGH